MNDSKRALWFTGSLLLALSACTAGVDTQPSSAPSTAPAQLAEADATVPPPPRPVIDLALVEAAIENLRTPQPVTIEMITTGALGTEAELVDSTMVDPTSTVKWIHTDHSALAAAVTEALPAAMEAEEAGDAEETMLPAFAAVASASSIPITYVIDGETMWLPVDVLAEYSHAEIEMVLVMASGEENEFLDEYIASLPDPDDWRGRWVALPYRPDARVAFPPGFGADLDISMVEGILAQAGLLERDLVDEEYVIGAMVAGLEIAEIDRTAELSMVEVTIPGKESMLLGIDAQGTIRRIELDGGARRFDLTWDVDASLMVAPEATAALTKEETAAWLGLDPACITENMTIVDDSYSVDPDCVLDEGASENEITAVAPAD